MNRKVWDQLVSTAGVVLAVALIVLGGLAIYGGNFGQQNVRDRLEPQKVFFAPYDAMTPTEQQEVGDFAGQQVVNGTHVVEVLSCHQTVPAPGTRLGSRCWRKFRRHRNCFASAAPRNWSRASRSTSSHPPTSPSAVIECHLCVLLTSLRPAPPPQAGIPRSRPPALGSSWRRSP